jgi:hypothetical protein
MSLNSVSSTSHNVLDVNSFSEVSTIKKKRGDYFLVKKLLSKHSLIHLKK